MNFVVSMQNLKANIMKNSLKAGLLALTDHRVPIRPARTFARKNHIETPIDTRPKKQVSTPPESSYRHRKKRHHKKITIGNCL